MKRSMILAAILACSLPTCSAADIVKNKNSITLFLDHPQEGGARQVRLTVIDDRIIRVEATPDAMFQEKKSLMIVPDAFNKKVKWKYDENEQDFRLSTRLLEVQVDKKTGSLRFTDKSTGKTLLEECAEGGKRFSRYVSSQTMLPANYQPSDADELNWGCPDNQNVIRQADREGYSWQARFESPSDEAFYGLGQHQSEEMNYKGRNEELFQYNTKVSVPFVVSNRNYGLLWDSYSYGRWGNAQDYRQLYQVFRLYDKEGHPGALTGTYTDQKGNQLVRREDSIYYEHSRSITNLPQQINLNGATVTYEGYIEADESALYHFILYYAGYTRVYADGKELVPERWRTAWNPNAFKFELSLKKQQRIPIRIEWQPDGGTSYCGLRVAPPQADEEQNRISIWNEMAKYMDYYFISGKNIDEVISGYRTLTGKAQVMPKWALGFWQSRERYKSQKEIVSTLEEFRKREIPIDNIVQDWNYWADDAWGSHEFESRRFPNPQQMLDRIHELNGRYMISVWPKFYRTTQHYQQLDAHGWMYQQAITDSIRDWVGPGYIGSFYDAYSSGARKLFWQQMDQSLYSRWNQGIDAWWMDASEPNVRDCTPIDYRKQLCGPTALGTSDEYFNAYSIVNADAIYHGQRSVNPDKRVFLLTRSGFAGLQRYSTATWSGDIGTRWEDMRAQMTAGINFSMSGIPFWGMDQGGFCVENRYVKAQQLYNKKGIENDDLKEWRELQVRWNQFGCFIPLYRTHGQWPTREVWNIAPDNHPAYQTIVSYDKLRYRLMPYLYSMAGWVNLHDYTLLRGLVMDYSEDPQVLNIGNQWMFGPSLMACPVSEYGARSREVYLPKSCNWYDLYSGRHIRGGSRLQADAPFERIPVYAPEGAILPVGPDMQWSDEKPADTLDVYIFAGRDGSFELYEDEGLNYNYEKGMYSTILLSYDDLSRKLTIGKRQGEFEGMLRQRCFRLHLVSPSIAQTAAPSPSPHPLILGGARDIPCISVLYQGKKLTVQL